MSGKQPKPEPRRNEKLKIELEFEDAIRAALETPAEKKAAPKRKRPSRPS